MKVLNSSRKKVKTKIKATKGKKASESNSDRPILKKAADVLARKNPNGTVSLLHLKNDSHFYSLDGIAAELWMMIDGKKSLNSIKKKLVQKYEPPLLQFDKDVKKLISKLVKEKLLVS